jgi:NAD(P)-dependent dehydrogenase (short-subunit alcohol dehydrogenase family)
LEKKLKGKVALVTGATRGIGRGHALRLGQLGADVIINDISMDAWKEYDEPLTAPSVMEEVKRFGVKSIGIEADITSKSAVDRMVQQALAGFGRIDILVNNAGGLAGEVAKSFASSVPEDQLRATIDRNLIGTIFCCQAVAPSMKAQKWGRIVTTASQAGMRSQDGGIYASYGAAKAGVIMYTRYLAQELGPFGITVNCLAPAFVSTGRLEKLSYSRPGGRDRSVAQTPLGRLAVPEDIAKVMEFFVTDLGDFVTGQCLSVCGGVIRF